MIAAVNGVSILLIILFPTIIQSITMLEKYNDYREYSYWSCNGFKLFSWLVGIDASGDTTSLRIKSIKVFCLSI